MGAKPPNAFGLFDMTGNVGQCTEDCYDNDYAPALADGCANDAPSGECKFQLLFWVTRPKIPGADAHWFQAFGVSTRSGWDFSWDVLGHRTADQNDY